MSAPEDVARELLAYPGAGDAKGTMVAPAADIAALCRALIARTEALRELQLQSERHYCHCDVIGDLRLTTAIEAASRALDGEHEEKR